MVESDDLHSAEGRREEFRLTRRERKYIRSGESGTDRPSRLMENIRSKRDRLPERFRELFLDVQEFAHGDYFEPREWEDEWMRLMEAHNSERVDREFSRFGRELGKMTRELTLYPEDISKNDIWADIIFGFIDGLAIQNWEGHPRRRGEYLQTLLNSVEERSEVAFDERASREESWFNERQAERQKAAEGEQQIVEVLESEGVEEPRSIALQVAGILGDERLRVAPEDVSPESVLDIVETHDLLLRRNLRETISHDIDELQTRQFGNLTPLDVLEEITEVVHPVSSRDIADRIGSPQEYLNNVVKLCLFLVGEQEIDGEVWEGIEVIESVGEVDTYGQREWKLTSYGKALRSRYLGRSSSFYSFMGKEFEEEHINHALHDPDVRDHLQ